MKIHACWFYVSPLTASLSADFVHIISLLHIITVHSHSFLQNAPPVLSPFEIRHSAAEIQVGHTRPRQ